MNSRCLGLTCYFSTAEIVDEMKVGANTADSQLVQGLSREIPFSVIGLVIIKLRSVTLSDHHRTPPRRRKTVQFKTCQDPLFSDVTWQKVERWDKKIHVFLMDDSRLLKKKEFARTNMSFDILYRTEHVSSYHDSLI